MIDTCWQVSKELSIFPQSFTFLSLFFLLNKPQICSVHGNFIELYDLDEYLSDDFNAREYEPIRTHVFEVSRQSKNVPMYYFFNTFSENRGSLLCCFHRYRFECWYSLHSWNHRALTRDHFWFRSEEEGIDNKRFFST